MAKSDVITRKDMKEPDKFQQVATQAASWIAARRRQVIAAGVAAAAALVILGIVTAVNARREERAGAAAAELLATASGEISSVPLPGMPGPFFPTDEARQRAVVATATKVVAEHPGTGAAQLAALALGDAYLKLREWDLAKGAFQRFLAGGKDDSLRFGALEGIAIADEGKGELDAAGQDYERLAREAPAFADRADLERARILAQQGKVVDAKALLADFTERHKESLLTPEASERLARLGANK